MRFAGLTRFGRFAARMAGLFAPQYLGGTYLARLTSRPYVHPTAGIQHAQLTMEPNSYVGERVIVHEALASGPVNIGRGTSIMRDCIIETGQSGSVVIGADSFVHPRCMLVAYKGTLKIGSNTSIAAGCALYAYNHSFEPGIPTREQPLRSAGGISVGNGVWLGYGVIVLDGVEIGDGAVIGAGAVVSKSIPPNAVAVGNPARVARFRGEPRASTTTARINP